MSEAEKFDQLLADTVALIDTLDEKRGFDEAREKRQDLLFVAINTLAEIKQLNLDEPAGSDFGQGHMLGQLFLARKILVKIKKELG